MPAKNKKRPAALNIQADFAAHVEANAKAHGWAAKSLALRATGKIAQANAAEAVAKGWLKKVLILENLAAAGKPQGGRQPELEK